MTGKTSPAKKEKREKGVKSSIFLIGKGMGRLLDGRRQLSERRKKREVKEILLLASSRRKEEGKEKVLTQPSLPSYRNRGKSPSVKR